MDLVAPADATTIISTTSPSLAWGTDGKTSCAAAHVSGAIALLRSEFLDKIRYPNITPEPEDYENMLKASAFDLNYGHDTYANEDTQVGYDDLTGWGQLRIGEVFRKLRHDGYVLKHYIIPGTLVYGDWSDEIDKGIVIREQVRRKDCETGFYKHAKKRTVSKTYTIPDNWISDINNKIYVWGTSGNTTMHHKGGFNAAVPLYLTAFTEVTNGQGGNGIVKGIIMPENLNVTAQTYQFKLKKDDNSQEFLVPQEENIELYISVFGKLGGTSVDDDLDTKSSHIYPNPTIDFIEIKSIKGSNISIFNT